MDRDTLIDAMARVILDIRDDQDFAREKARGEADPERRDRWLAVAEHARSNATVAMDAFEGLARGLGLDPVRDDVTQAVTTYRALNRALNRTRAS